jgi:hypothetical protein
VLEAHADENVRAFQLAPLFENNPVFMNLLLSQSMLSRKVSDWTEEDPKRTDKEVTFMRRSLSLLGKSATRNLAASIRLARAGEVATPRKKTDRLLVQPSAVLPSAIAAEAFCMDRSWVHPEIAFWAGLHYDWLATLVTARKAPKEIKTVLYEAFREGFRIGQLSYDIARQLKQVPHSRFVFAASVVAPIGKALLSAAFAGTGGVTTWTGHLQSCEKLGSHRSYGEEFREPRHFPVSHFELSALYVSSLGLLAEAEPAIRFSREPWMLEGQPEQQQLATILCISTALAAATRIPATQPLPLRKFELDWLAQNHVSEESLRKAMAAVQEVRTQ